MKRLLILALSAALLSAPVLIVETGCVTPPKTVAFQSLSAVNNTVNSALQAYSDLLVKGKVDQATQVKVFGAKLKYQLAFKLALEAASGNGDFPAQGDVVTLANELGDLLRLILAKK